MIATRETIVSSSNIPSGQRQRSTSVRIEALMEQARWDYAFYHGLYLCVSMLYGYDDEGSVEIECNPPVMVRVKDTSDADVCRFHGNWLDPQWNVDLVDGTLRDEIHKGSLWVDGISYSLDGSVEQPKSWVVAE